MVAQGKTEWLDRWKMTIQADELKEFTIYNYLGSCCDR